MQLAQHSSFQPLRTAPDIFNFRKILKEAIYTYSYKITRPQSNLARLPTDTPSPASRCHYRSPFLHSLLILRPASIPYVFQRPATFCANRIKFLSEQGTFGLRQVVFSQNVPGKMRRFSFLRRRETADKARTTSDSDGHPPEAAPLEQSPVKTRSPIKRKGTFTITRLATNVEERDSATNAFKHNVMDFQIEGLVQGGENVVFGPRSNYSGRI